MEDTTITIQPVKSTTDLLCVYPGQDKPQACYIGLDLRDGFVSAFYNPEIGNAVPIETAHGIIRRYPIPLLGADSVNALMESLKPALSQVRAGSEIVWNGSNQVALLSDTASTTEAYIEAMIGNWEEDLYWADASDWCSDDVAGVRALVQQNGIDQTMRQLDGDGTDEDSPVLIGLRQYLEGLQEQARA